MAVLSALYVFGDLHYVSAKKTMKNKIKEAACTVVGGVILIGTLVGAVLYALLGGVIHLNKREVRPCARKSR